MAIGLRSVFADLGIILNIDLLTDSSAAKGIANRRGLGKVRHLETNQLWIQERVAKGDITVHKVAGVDNLADALTKYVTKDELNWHSEKIGQFSSAGRHHLAPEITRDNINYEDKDNSDDEIPE